jgi:CHAT domain
MIDVRLSPTRIYAADPAELEISLINNGPGTCTNIRFAITIPLGLVRLRGPDTIQQSRLLPGQSATTRLLVSAETAGQYRLTSTNFSYRDHRGQSHLEKGFAAEITVDPEREQPPEPEVTAGFMTAELPYDEWAILRAGITNTGAVNVSGLEAALSGQVVTDRRTARARLEQLPPGRTAEIPFFVCARDAGEHVPVHLDVSYGYQSHRREIEVNHGIRVVRGATSGSAAYPSSGRSVVKVLLLAANPPGTDRLRVDKEIREIQRTIRSGLKRDNIEVDVRLAVQPEDISQALLDEKPHVVHFAGHGGGPDRSFVAENEYGLAHIVSVAGLVQLFSIAGRSVECVIINACETDVLAQELSGCVRYAIGMQHPIRDRSAIRFSIGFYQALAAGLPVDDAFGLGAAQLMVSRADTDADASAPVLYRRDVSQ